MVTWRELSRIALLITFPVHLLFGTSSALDFLKFVNGPPSQTGASIGADKDGYVYAVGVTESPATFPVTPGALNVPPGNRPMVFLQKFSPDGAQVLVSALIGETYTEGFTGNQVTAKVDGAGNVYVAFPLSGKAAGAAPWKGDPAGGIAVLKVGPSGDKILSASRVFPKFVAGPAALALDSDGSIYVVGEDLNSQVWKLDPSGNLADYSYTFADSSIFDGRYIRVAVLPDHSLFVMASPSFLYRLDSKGKSILSQANVGNGSVQLLNLAADTAGNAYVSGLATSTYSVPSKQIGFTTGLPLPVPALIVKFDSSGSVVYSDLFPLEQIAALTVNAAGDVWAGGLSSFGFTLFELDVSGTRLLHYFTLAVPVSSLAFFDNQLGMASLDNQGRLLVAGCTTALGFPDFNTSRDQFGNENAFFLRVSSNPPQADLQLSVTASPPAVTLFQTILYRVEITNRGAVPANDVILRMRSFVPSSGLDPTDLISCTATGQGTCELTGTNWTVSFPQIGAHSAASVELQIFIPAQLISPLHFPLVVLTSTDDPTQSNNLAAADVVIGLPAYSLDANISSPFVVDVAGVGEIPIGCFPEGFFCSNSLPVTPGSSIRIHIPTPQWSYSTLYAFDSWSDGSTDNPRTFPAGVRPAGVELRPVTEPWVDPDAGIVHSASYRSGAVSPGEVITLEGVNLGPSTLQTAQLDSQGRIATEVGGFQVLFDNAPAPVVYTSARQSAVIVPYSVAGKQTVQMTMQYQQATSQAIPITIVTAAPGLFASNASGAGLLAAFNSNNSLNTRINPASQGDVVVFFATGEGLTNPTPPNGQIAGPDAPKPKLPVAVSIGGQPADVLYSGGVPGFTAGIMQVNVRIPQSALSGLLPVLLTVGTHTSQVGVTVAVR